MVTSDTGPIQTASGLPFPGQRSTTDVTHTDIVIVPSMMVENGVWHPGRHPDVVRWLSDMHSAGALLCSACSGAMLIAETGLLDEREATVHWAYADTFRDNFPTVRLRLEEALIVTGDHNQFVMSGAATSWQDLVLYLIARKLGPATAQAVAKFYAFQWHADGLAPYAVFDPRVDHGDAVLLRAQEWLARHLAADHPVEEMVTRSGLPERSFSRRFRKATGHAPLAYVQRLRVERAKTKLESSDEPVEEICWSIGYEDASSFRRLFKRMVGISPGAYRRKFRLPHYAQFSDAREGGK
jgi:transcriptional regulator GlxA family with amidase domain